MISELTVICTSPLVIRNIPDEEKIGTVEEKIGTVYFKMVSDKPYLSSVHNKVELIGFINGDEYSPLTCYFLYFIDYDGVFHLCGNPDIKYPTSRNYGVKEKAELNISHKGNIPKKILIP